MRTIGHKYAYISNRNITEITTFPKFREIYSKFSMHDNAATTTNAIHTRYTNIEMVLLKARYLLMGRRYSLVSELDRERDRYFTVCRSR